MYSAVVYLNFLFFLPGCTCVKFSEKQIPMYFMCNLGEKVYFYQENSSKIRKIIKKNIFLSNLSLEGKTNICSNSTIEIPEQGGIYV